MCEGLGPKQLKLTTMSELNINKQPRLKPYDGFAEEWERLPHYVFKALGDFLRMLQANPYHPEILSKCQIEENFYGYEFAEDYVIFWKLKHAAHELTTIESGGVERIDILEVLENIRNPLTTHGSDRLAPRQTPG